MSTAMPRPDRPRLTVALLACGDHDYLGRALSSAGLIADELLVIDCGQRTELAEIAAQHQARHIVHPWQDSFAQARNAGIAAANGDWLFWLEEDEYLSPDQAQSLRDLVDQQTGPDRAWLAYVEGTGTGSHEPAQRIARPRLFPNRPGIQFEGRVAETANVSLTSLGIGIELSQVTISRDAQYDDPAVRRGRARRDMKLLDKELPERGPQPRLLCLLGESHLALGNPVAAGKYYQQAVRAGQPGSPELLSAYYGLLTTIDDAHHETRLTICLEALEVYPFDAQLLCAAGSYLQSQNRLEMACRAYQAAVQVGQVHPETWHLAEVGEVAAHCLATIWELQKQDETARQVLREALLRYPTSTRLRLSLIDLDVRRGRLIDALGQMEKLPADFSNREAFRTAVRGACQAARGNWVPATAYLQTAYDGGCREAICLRWLSISLISTGRAEDAQAILRQWKLLDPGNLEVRRYLASVSAESASAEQRVLSGRQTRFDAPQPQFDAGGSPMSRTVRPVAAH